MTSGELFRSVYAVKFQFTFSTRTSTILRWRRFLPWTLCSFTDMRLEGLVALERFDQW